MIFGTLYTSMQLQKKKTHSFAKIPLVQRRNKYQFYTADGVIIWRTFLHFSEFLSERARYVLQWLLVPPRQCLFTYYIQYISSIKHIYGYACSTSHELWKQIRDYTIPYNITQWSVDVLVCRRFGVSTFWPVDVLVCRRFGLLTFWFVDVLVCRRFGLSTFRFVDVSVCRRFGLSTFRSVDVSVCRRFGLSTFWLSTFRFVDVLTSYRKHL